ncbi:di-heme oxidoredictase family protein, partial [Mesorhizobium sp.]
PPQGDAGSTSMFLRLARDASSAEEKAALADHKVLNFPDPVYGAQLQDLAVPGLKSEGRARVEYSEEKATLGDGTVVSLRKPRYSVENPGYGPLDPRTT